MVVQPGQASSDDGNGDGAVYVGETWAGMKHGRGRYTSDGELYDGYWYYDLAQGPGKQLTSDGITFSGYFLANQREGFGTLRLPDGISHEGLFRSGTLYGIGARTYPDGRCDVGFWNKEHLQMIFVDLWGLCKVPYFSEALSLAPVSEPLAWHPRVELSSSAPNQAGPTLAPSVSLYQMGKVPVGLDLKPVDFAHLAKTFRENFLDKGSPEALPEEEVLKERRQLLTDMRKFARKMQPLDKRMTMPLREVSVESRNLQFGKPGEKEQEVIAFLEAAFAGDTRALATLIYDRMVNVDVCDANGLTALTAASLSGHIDAMKLLLDAGADVGFENNNNQTAADLCFLMYQTFTEKYNLWNESEPDITTVLTDFDKQPLIFGAPNSPAAISKPGRGSIRRSIQSPSQRKRSASKPPAASASKMSKTKKSINATPNKTTGKKQVPDAVLRTGLAGSEVKTVTQETKGKSRRTALAILKKLSSSANVNFPEEAEELRLDIEQKGSWKSIQTMKKVPVSVQAKQFFIAAAQLEDVIPEPSDTDIVTKPETEKSRFLLWLRHWQEKYSGSLQLLFSRGADWRRCVWPQPLILTAARAGDGELMHVLMDKGCDPNQRIIRQSVEISPLLVATSKPGLGAVRTVESLLAAKADPNIAETAIVPVGTPPVKEKASTKAKSKFPPFSGRYPLHVACARDQSDPGNPELLEALLKAGALPDVVWNGSTPLAMTVRAANVELSKILLAYESDENKDLGNGIGNALCVAATLATFDSFTRSKSDNDTIKQLVDLLLQHSADFTVKVALNAAANPTLVQFGSPLDYAKQLYAKPVLPKNVDPAVKAGLEDLQAYILDAYKTGTQKSVLRLRKIQLAGAIYPELIPLLTHQPQLIDADDELVEAHLRLNPHNKKYLQILKGLRAKIDEIVLAEDVVKNGKVYRPTLTVYRNSLAPKDDESDLQSLYSNLMSQRELDVDDDVVVEHKVVHGADAEEVLSRKKDQKGKKGKKGKESITHADHAGLLVPAVHIIDENGDDIPVDHALMDYEYCSNCGETPTGKQKLIPCPKCEKVFYCSKQCLESSWPSHRDSCETIVQRKEHVEQHLDHTAEKQQKRQLLDISADSEFDGQSQQSSVSTLNQSAFDSPSQASSAFTFDVEVPVDNTGKKGKKDKKKAAKTKGDKLTPGSTLAPTSQATFASETLSDMDVSNVKLDGVEKEKKEKKEKKKKGKALLAPASSDLSDASSVQTGDSGISSGPDASGDLGATGKSKAKPKRQKENAHQDSDNIRKPEKANRKKSHTSPEMKKEQRKKEKRQKSSVTSVSSAPEADNGKPGKERANKERRHKSSAGSASSLHQTTHSRPAKLKPQKEVHSRDKGEKEDEREPETKPVKSRPRKKHGQSENELDNKRPTEQKEETQPQKHETKHHVTLQERRKSRTRSLPESNKDRVKERPRKEKPHRKERKNDDSDEELPKNEQTSKKERATKHKERPEGHEDKPSRPVRTKEERAKKEREPRPERPERHQNEHRQKTESRKDKLPTRTRKSKSSPPASERRPEPQSRTKQPKSVSEKRGGKGEKREPRDAGQHEPRPKKAPNRPAKAEKAKEDKSRKRSPKAKEPKSKFREAADARRKTREKKATPKSRKPAREDHEKVQKARKEKKPREKDDGKVHRDQKKKKKKPVSAKARQESDDEAPKKVRKHKAKAAAPAKQPKKAIETKNAKKKLLGKTGPPSAKSGKEKRSDPRKLKRLGSAQRPGHQASEMAWKKVLRAVAQLRMDEDMSSLFNSRYEHLIIHGVNLASPHDIVELASNEFYAAVADQQHRTMDKVLKPGSGQGRSTGQFRLRRKPKSAVKRRRPVARLERPQNLRILPKQPENFFMFEKLKTANYSFS